MESGYQKKTGWGVYIDVQYVILLILKSSLFQGSKFANRDVDIFTTGADILQERMVELHQRAQCTPRLMIYMIYCSDTHLQHRTVSSIHICIRGFSQIEFSAHRAAPAFLLKPFTACARLYRAQEDVHK